MSATIEIMIGRLQKLTRDIGGITRETLHYLVTSDARLLVGSLAFGTVLSLVPLLAVSLSVFQAFGGFEPLMQKIEPILLDNFVAGAGRDAQQAIQNAIRRVHSGTLGLWGAVGLLLASTKLFIDIELAVQRIWGLKGSRPLWMRLGIYWSVMFLGPLALAAVIGLVSSIDLGLLIEAPKGTISFLFTYVALFAFYKFLPARKVRVVPAAISGILAAGAVVAAEIFFAVAAKEVLVYNRLYGGLATVPFFLIWILIMWWIGLAGVALTRALDERFTPTSREAT